MDYIISYYRYGGRLYFFGISYRTGKNALI